MSSPRRRPPLWLRAATLVLAALLFAAVPLLSADAEVSRHGNLIGSFQSSVSPRFLPRHRPAPVAVRVAGRVSAVAGAPLPQLRTITIALNRAGRLDAGGLPICRVASIQPATEANARAACRRALVGAGHVTFSVHLPSQPSFAVRSRLLAFNGPRRHGRPLILAQVYSRRPLGAFILAFSVSRTAGLFGTVLRATLPRSARGWAYLTRFEMTLRRTYRRHGRRRSYLSAACSTPPGVPAAVFPFARARYDFAGGPTVSATDAGSCRVRP